MKLSFLPLTLALVALPALAQDRTATIFFDKAPGENGTITLGGSTVDTLKPKDFSGLGLKFGMNVAKFGPATLEFNASYRFKSKEDLAIDGAYSGYQYEWGYVSAGADVNFTKVVDFGAGLDLRSQTDALILTAGSSTQKYGLTRVSPWLRAHVGYTFDTGAVKPFVALEGAWDLGNDTSYDATGSSLDISKAYGVGLPKKEYSLQAGIRF